jgi:hypothetical protein
MNTNKKGNITEKEIVHGPCQIGPKFGLWGQMTQGYIVQSFRS